MPAPPAHAVPTLAGDALRWTHGVPLCDSYDETSTLFVCVRFFFSSRRRHTRLQGDWSSDVCSSDLLNQEFANLPDGVAVSPGAISITFSSPSEALQRLLALAMRSAERRVEKECR